TPIYTLSLHDALPISSLRVRDVIQIRLGGVTGDARYFLLTEQERIAFDLPTTSLRPVVSRAHHLSAGRIVSADWRELNEMEERRSEEHTSELQSQSNL